MLPELNIEHFYTEEEQKLIEKFLSDGYVIVSVEDNESLNKIRETIIDITTRHLDIKKISDDDAFLNNIFDCVSVEKLNALRLAVINELNSQSWFRRNYFNLARKTIEMIVGNDLVMQRRVNISIQLPGDDSSILPVHADVLDGNSPFEVVQWTPYVDCYKTKSMFILPPDANAEFMPRLADFQGQGADALMNAIEPHLKWLDVNYGQVLVFNQNLLHGNIINQEAETRWTSNCRYKGAFTPYADKKLGEFFEPILLRPASSIGMRYQQPTGFKE